MNEDEVADSVESQFARRLAGNDKKSRDRALKKLKQYMCLRSQKNDGGFNRDEMLRIWKGLFYCMWMSDKPLVQEELSKSMCDLMLDLRNTKTTMLFFDVFLQTMLREWDGIDRLRMDKFYLLIRNMLEATFKFIKSKEWEAGIIDWTLAILKNGPISPVQPYSGMHYHLCDIYLEEFAKVATDSVSADVVMKFLDPYCLFITKARNNDLQLVENSKPALDLMAEEENDELIVQVRSNTQLPSFDSSPVALLCVDYTALADRIYSLAIEQGVLAKSKKKAFSMVGKFRELAEGRLPLDDIPDAEYSSEDELATLKQQLTATIYEKSNEEFDENQRLKRTRRKRRANQQDSMSDVELVEPKQKKLVEVDADKIENSEEDLAPCAKPKDKKKKRKATKKKNVDSNANCVSKPSPSNGKVLVADVASDARDETKISSNMPDLIQDISKCTQAVESLRDNVEVDFKNLKNWLRTAKDCSPGDSEYSDTVSETLEGDTSAPLQNSIVGLQNGEGSKRVGIRKKKKAQNKLTEEEHKKTGCKSLNQSNNLPVDEVCTLESEKASKSPKMKLKKEKARAGRETQSEASPFKEITSVDSTASATAKRKKTSVSKPTEQNSRDTNAKEDIDSLSGANTLVTFAAKKLKKSATKKHSAAVKRKPQPVRHHTPKKVAFEMSRTQIKPFRKTEKTMACSPSPAIVAFDPAKRPDFGLLKARRLHRTSKRSKASDFFGDSEMAG